MPGSKVLYISGSIGLGHVMKDRAIVNKLREIRRDAEITWIATNPATEYLEGRGEYIHPLAHKFSSTGPRLTPVCIRTSPGIEVKGFIPDLYQHFAACDLAVVQGGFSSTLELTSLERPFIYFPIEDNSEQAYVSKRLNRHQAGIRMDLSKTTPTQLAECIMHHLHDAVTVTTLNTNGAVEAAMIMSQWLAGQGKE